MNVLQLHDDLYDLGVRLVRDGDALSADVQPGVGLTPHLATIRAHKAELLAAVGLRDRITAAATIDPSKFDRASYDELWREWELLNTQQEDAA